MPWAFHLLAKNIEEDFVLSKMSTARPEWLGWESWYLV